VVSNYPAIAPTTAAAAQAVVLKSSMAFGANASYTHWWADNIRSYIAGGIQHHDVPVNLRTVAGGGTPGSTGVSPGGSRPPGGRPLDCPPQWLSRLRRNQGAGQRQLGTNWGPGGLGEFRGRVQLGPPPVGQQRQGRRERDHGPGHLPVLVVSRIREARRLRSA